MGPQHLPTTVIAIDGPAGAGKSTVAWSVAAELGLNYVDTGAIYRALALASMRRCIALSDEDRLEALAVDLPIVFQTSPSSQTVLLDGEDVSEAIRTEEVSAASSRVSRHRKVRAALLALQRALGARPPGAVLEGRDIGTVVFPGAQVKIFLTASDDVRARRRKRQRTEAGADDELGEILSELRKRDARDKNRSVAPLTMAEDATALDTSAMSFDEVVAAIIEVARTRLA